MKASQDVRQSLPRDVRQSLPRDVRQSLPRFRAPLRCALAALTALGLAAVVSSCRDNLGEKVTNLCPDQAVFQASVSPYMERRCGTLDCHGGIARPMRLYGRSGLRHPGESNVSGGAGTTAAELDANYFSVCNVDAEKMDQIANNGNVADESLLITKARGAEKHKGGTVVNETNDPGNDCLLGWLVGADEAIVADACQRAVDAL
jgi:hypothetical protein